MAGRRSGALFLERAGKIFLLVRPGHACDGANAMIYIRLHVAVNPEGATYRRQRSIAPPPAKAKSSQKAGCRGRYRRSAGTT